MKQEEFNEQFRQRTKRWALAIIKLLSPLKYSDALGIMRKQEIRACTSVASNFRASCRARSQRELFSKLCNVVEEADESCFWLEMLQEAGYLTPEEVAEVHMESNEILMVMSSYKKKVESTL
ncbi:MAG TPA: four helix bundle protein [Saprospiraceae bacterium]